MSDDNESAAAPPEVPMTRPEPAERLGFGTVQSRRRGQNLRAPSAVVLSPTGLIRRPTTVAPDEPVISGTNPMFRRQPTETRVMPGAGAGSGGEPEPKPEPKSEPKSKMKQLFQFLKQIGTKEKGKDDDNLQKRFAKMPTDVRSRILEFLSPDAMENFMGRSIYQAPGYNNRVVREFGDLADRTILSLSEFEDGILPLREVSATKQSAKQFDKGKEALISLLEKANKKDKGFTTSTISFSENMAEPSLLKELFNFQKAYDRYKTNYGDPKINPMKGKVNYHPHFAINVHFRRPSPDAEITGDEKLKYKVSIIADGKTGRDAAIAFLNIYKRRYNPPE